MQRRTEITRELAGLTEQCVEVVWTNGENREGPFGEKNSRIRCERSEFERKAMDGWCEKNIE